MRVRFFSCACTSQAADGFGGEQTNGVVAIGGCSRETRKKKNRAAAVRLSAPLPTRAWKPAELITSAPVLVPRGAKEDGK